MTFQLSIGQKLVFAYLFLFLFVPAFSHVMSGPAPWNQYHFMSPSPLFLISITTITALLFFPLHSKRPSYIDGKLAQSLQHVSDFLNKNILIVSLALAFGLFVSTYFTPNHLRYLSSGISSAGKAAMIMLVLKSIVGVLLLKLVVGYVQKGQQHSKSERFSAILLALAHASSVGGQGDLLSALMFGCFALTPKIFTKLVFVPIGQPTLSSSTAVQILSPFVLFLALYATLYFGEGIKSGRGLVPVAGAFEHDPGFLLTRIIDRLSSHYYSAVNLFNNFGYFELEKYQDPKNYVFEGFRYRVLTAIGAENIIRPDIQSISKLNFEILSLKDSLGQGTSPGVLASFAYLVPFELTIVFCIIYLRFAITILTMFFTVHTHTLSFGGSIIMLHEVLFLFQSPIDFFLILDNTTVVLIMFICFSLVNSVALTIGHKHG